MLPCCSLRWSNGMTPFSRPCKQSELGLQKNPTFCLIASQSSASGTIRHKLKSIMGKRQ